MKETASRWKKLIPPAAAWILFAAPSPARACSCSEGSVAQRLSKTKDVFYGKVLEQKLVEPADGKGAGYSSYKFKVTENFKGKSPKTLWLNSTNDPAACPMYFILGSEYAVFMNEKKDWTDSCRVLGPGLTASQLDQLRGKPAATPGGPSRANSPKNGEASETDQKLSRLHSAAGLVLIQKGDIAKAREEFGAALQLDPQNGEASAGLTRSDQFKSAAPPAGPPETTKSR